MSNVKTLNVRSCIVLVFKFELYLTNWHQSGSSAHGQEFVPAGFQCEDVVDVDCDVLVTKGLLREGRLYKKFMASLMMNMRMMMLKSQKGVKIYQ